MDSDLLRCNCGCRLNNATPELIRVLTSLEISMGRTVTVHSGCRCWGHHLAIYRKLGKEPTKRSYHLRGMAADVSVTGYKASVIIKELRALFGDGVWCYEINEYTVHVDVRRL